MHFVVRTISYSLNGATCSSRTVKFWRLTNSEKWYLEFKTHSNIQFEKSVKKIRLKFEVIPIWTASWHLQFRFLRTTACGECVNAKLASCYETSRLAYLNALLILTWQLTSLQGLGAHSTPWRRSSQQWVWSPGHRLLRVRIARFIASGKGVAARLAAFVTSGRKIAKSFVVPLCQRATARLPLDGVSWNLIVECFSKIFRENSSSIEIWEE
jgi:hypothetical protein